MLYCDAHLTPAGAFAARAQSDLAIVYAGLTARAYTSGIFIGSDLGGRVLSSGVYTSPTYLVLGGQLILDARGDSNAVWVFVRCE